MKSPRTTGNKAKPMSWKIWTICHQNWEPVNFVPESRLPFIQISSIYRKTAPKVWNWYQRWLSRNRTWISVWNIPSGETGLPFQVFRCSRKFSVGKTQKVAFYLLSKQILRKLFIGKQSSFSRLKRNPRERSLWCGCPGNFRWRCAYSSESNWTKKIMII